jgi:hypothetical protein
MKFLRGILAIFLLSWAAPALPFRGAVLGEIAPRHLASVFESILPALKEKTKLPILLPSELPDPTAKAKFAVVRGAQASDYAILLYYELGVGDSGFAASFFAQAGANYSPSELKGIRKVKLERGNDGFFKPISCGGSCAPANLWWQDKGVLYQVQLKLSSTTSEGDQEKTITAVANSAILAGPR